MRTVFVNPRNPAFNIETYREFNKPRKKRRRRKAPKRRAKRASRRAAPRSHKGRGRRRRTARISKGYPLTVRSNVGISPFVQNPMIIGNPRRRRHRYRSARLYHRNPFMNLSSLNMSTIFTKTLKYGGGAAAGAAINILGLRRIQNDWVRNGVRIAAAVLGATLMPGDVGAAYAGATLYPAMAELALLTKLVQPAGTPTEADLSEISADLEDVLDELDDEDLF